MEQDGKPRKAVGIAWGEGEDDKGEFDWCEFVYCETVYSFKTSYSRLAVSQWADLSIDDLFHQIANDLEKSQHSSILQDVLNEKAVTLRVSPAEKWYEPGGMLRELPQGERRRKKELVSYFLADVLQSYIDKHDDTPSKDELWNWLFTLWWERPSHFLKKWEISGDPKNGGDPATGYAYTRKSDRATSKTLMTTDSFRKQFTRTINTTSNFHEFKKWDKKQKTIEKMTNKKPRGRPRKKYP